jgi:uncharacterized protein (TIGR02271 family)
MSQETIVAVFETSAHADKAVRALEAAGVPSDAIERREKENESSESGPARALNSGPPSTGFFFWDIMFGAQSPHQDRSEYERSVDRGETALAVTVSDQESQKVISVLEACSPLDVEESEVDDESAEAAPVAPGRTETPTARARPGDSDKREVRERIDTEEDEDAQPSETVTRERTSQARQQQDEGEEVIPLGEEELEVGKRRVNRGTTRIRRYVVETPVEQPVSLRDERVIVERRRPVTDTATGDALTEKTVEVTETSEVPVARKVARLAEEVVVRREAAERTETVRDTVRQDRIAVENASEAPARRRSNS